MKKILVLLILLLPKIGHSQYVMYANYPADSVAKMIIKGTITQYFADTVEFIYDKDLGKQKSKFVSNKVAEQRLLRALHEGNCDFGAKTNRGYSFSIYVLDKNNEMSIIMIIAFKVNIETRKIETIIISTD